MGRLEFAEAVDVAGYKFSLIYHLSSISKSNSVYFTVKPLKSHPDPVYVMLTPQLPN